MAKKTDSPALLPDAPAGDESPATPPPDAASPPDVAALGRTWLDKQVGIDESEAAFHAALKARKVVAARPIVLDGRRFFPGLKGKVKEVRDFS